MTSQRIGIIDIGSNSVRLVIYERTSSGAHRVVDGSKRSARLSGHIDSSGSLHAEAVRGLIDTVHHFARICSLHGAGHIRAVATAAIRGAANRDSILQQIKAETGFTIELLSGEEEASYGFLGMINSLSVSEGYLIDIGGGSTELSLFRNRTLIHSVSFPFGCVNMEDKFNTSGGLSDQNLKALESEVAHAIKQHDWIKKNPGLPLVGVGGTVRALGKLHQELHHYPFTQIHNYMMTGNSVDELFQSIRLLPLDRRRKLPRLSKDRADVIVPGTAILRMFYRAVQADHYQICGAGLRDGLFHATRFPNRPKLDDPLDFSLTNISSLHSEVPRQHVLQVNRLAIELFETLGPLAKLSNEARTLLDSASRLYRIGASIDYYDYAKHSFYLIVHSHLNGLSHRQIIMTAAVASFKSKSKAKSQILPYRALVNDSDLELICKLGAMLQLAAALDRSETQAIGHLSIRIAKDKLLLRPIHPRDSLKIERQEIEELAGDFKKHWDIAPILESYLHND